MSEPKKPHFPSQEQRSAEQARLQALHDKNLAAARLNMLEIGEQTDDGMIYAGISPDTNKRMFLAPADEKFGISGTDTFTAAQQRAKDRSLETGKDYRVPSIREFREIFNNRAAIGSLSGTYWSSSNYFSEKFGQARDFDDNAIITCPIGHLYSVRLVRN